MIRFKKDGREILKELKQAGFTTYVIRERKLMSEVTVGHLRRSEMVSTDALNAICCMLRINLSDLVEFEITDEEKIKYF